MKTLPPVDAVIVGGGFTGLLMAKELGARTSLSVVVLERGKMRDLADYVHDMDELDYAIRHEMMQDCARETHTFRLSPGERALPVRTIGSFKPGTGVGGAGEHWGGVAERPLPDCFEIYSATVKRYGVKKLPKDSLLQDWGVTYGELEPYYAQMEKLLGISGKAGNLRGKRIEGGNIFEGERSTEFPTPPLKTPYLSAMFRDAAKSLGLHPYPNAAATISTLYTNPDGITRPGCTYCGYCERYGCMISAKAQPTNTFLPVVRRHSNVSIRTGAWVRRIVHAGTKDHGRATGVSYMDAAGEEVFQPAELVILASWTINNVRLLLLSGVGEPYNVATGKGTLGRNLTHQAGGGITVFCDRPLNLFMGAGASQICVSDFAGDIFDHSHVPFIRGVVLRAESSGHGPIANFGVLPQSIRARWGAEWKQAGIEYFNRTGSIGYEGEHMPYKTNYLDLDPTYKGIYGDPLIRMTLDWRENERHLAALGTEKAVEIARKMGAKGIKTPGPLGHYDPTHYQSTHLNGGTIMGPSPEHSVVNPYLQHWQLPNLFVLGGSTFPQNLSSHPTLTLLSLALRSADAMVTQYLKKPGPLA